MTPQQLKALLPTSNPVDSSNNITNNKTEKLYSVLELGTHFGINPDTVRYYVTKHQINHVESHAAKNGFSKYYRLSDFKNYIQVRNIKTLKKHLITDDEYDHTVREISLYYRTTKDLVNYYIKSRNIKCVYKPANANTKLSNPHQIRHFKFEDFNFLKKTKSKLHNQFKGLTLFQRIKLLFGLDI
jgi:hypothetical protein